MGRPPDDVDLFKPGEEMFAIFSARWLNDGGFASKPGQVYLTNMGLFWELNRPLYFEGIGKSLMRAEMSWASVERIRILRVPKRRKLVLVESGAPHPNTWRLWTREDVGLRLMYPERRKALGDLGLTHVQGPIEEYVRVTDT